MATMLTWDEVQTQYKDQWVVFTEWEEDEHGDVVKDEKSDGGKGPPS